MKGSDVLEWLAAEGRKYDIDSPDEFSFVDPRMSSYSSSGNVASYVTPSAEVQAFAFILIAWEMDGQGHRLFDPTDAQHITISLELRPASGSSLEARLGIAMQQIEYNSFPPKKAEPVEGENVILTGASAVWAFRRVASYAGSLASSSDIGNTGHRLYEMLSGKHS